MINATSRGIGIADTPGRSTSATAGEMNGSAPPDASSARERSQTQRSVKRGNRRIGMKNVSEVKLLYHVRFTQVNEEMRS